jgi:hypothetical protein
MSPDTSRIDLIIQYALLVAGEEDEFIDRQLGPIHLIKYVYLADLTYAQRNGGQTYTGTDWRFYKFGPWSQAVNERIEPALRAICAEKQTLPSDHEDRDDWVRWRLRDERLLREREQQLPVTIKLRLKQYVHKFGKDTPSLLDHVYRTEPMLSAAPNEYLDFSSVVNEQTEADADPQPLRMDSLSTRKKKQFKERLQQLRAQRKGRESRASKLINPVKNPRYDEVYEAGIAWLDDLAGPQLTPGDKVAEFTDDVWQSPARKGEDVS